MKNTGSDSTGRKSRPLPDKRKGETTDTYRDERSDKESMWLGEVNSRVVEIIIKLRFNIRYIISHLHE